MMEDEGYAKRETLPVFKKFLRDAIGEANEMINHIALAKAKKYLKPENANIIAVGNADLLQKTMAKILLVALTLLLITKPFTTCNGRRHG